MVDDEPLRGSSRAIRLGTNDREEDSMPVPGRDYDPGEDEAKDDVMFMHGHARQYGIYAGVEDPDDYADWYADQFGKDITTAPSHSTVIWVYLEEKRTVEELKIETAGLITEGEVVYSTTEPCRCGQVHPV